MERKSVLNNQKSKIFSVNFPDIKLKIKGLNLGNTFKYIQIGNQIYAHS